MADNLEAEDLAVEGDGLINVADLERDVIDTDKTRLHVIWNCRMHFVSAACES